MKAKLAVLLKGLIALAVELALLYPALLLDQAVNDQVASHFGPGAEWIAWIARAGIWISIVVIPIAGFLVGHSLLERWWRVRRLKHSVALATGPSTVRVVGADRLVEFRAKTLVRLAVPDAVTAVDEEHGLLRLKSIADEQDSAVKLANIIGVELQRGEMREARGRQSLFRNYDPTFRTLAELPRIRLEIETSGREPVLEYFLFADLPDAKPFEAFFPALQRAARRARLARPVSTRTMLDSLPVQGSRYSYVLS